MRGRWLSLLMLYFALLAALDSNAAPRGVEISADPLTLAQSGETDAYTAATETATEIPFRLIDRHIMVDVKIADTLEMEMILDTGMGLLRGAILLNPELGEILDLDYVDQIPLGGGGSEEIMPANVAVGATLSMDGVKFSDQQLIVVSDKEPYEDWPARGVIGRAVFDYVVEIDYDESVIKLYDELPSLSDDEWERFDLSFTYGIPVVDASVVVEEDEIDLKLIVDTGAEELLLFTYSEDEIEVPERVTQGVDGILSEGLLGEILGVTGRVPELELGDLLLENVITSFPDSATWGPAAVLGQNGIIGNDVLSRFDVILDYEREHLYLRANDQNDEPFEANMAGIIYLTTPNGWLKVFEVIADSPASEAGIERDDLIVAIDGQDVREIESDKLWDLFIQEGRKVTLTIERGSERFDVILVLRRLI